MLKRLLIGLLALVVCGVGLVFFSGRGVFGRHEGPGELTEVARPAATVRERTVDLASAAEAIGVEKPKQILFGDFHVHTTVSFDAFMSSLPMSQGEGAHPQADACDFARYCSALDFWSITDHAEGLTALNWEETLESMRQCNQVAGDPENPDTVAFVGWEWTQVGTTPENHYGHKNVILGHTDEDLVPARPIAARSTLERIRRGMPKPSFGLGLLALLGADRRYHDFVTFMAERSGIADCEDGVPVRDLPIDCVESAATPGELFQKLDEWGQDAIVIPHGTTWGFYSPPGISWDKQLTAAEDDPDRQTLLEIYSGHGNSDEYRDWRAIRFDENGEPFCPEPSKEYLPTCWQAGEIIRGRCLEEGLAEAECEERAVQARANAAAAGEQAFVTVPGATPEEWLDAGQCRDCDQPAFNYRPAGSAQYIMALRNFDDPSQPRSARFGFMSSSDNHYARPGTGYKEIYRHGNTESRERVFEGAGPVAAIFARPVEEPVAESRPFDYETTELSGFQLFETERQASFFLTGGLIATHAEGRDREAIWQALMRKEVYGTSGPRILLWFDLLNPPGSRGTWIPMGSETEMSSNPIFRVRAVGSFEQDPGCPDYAVNSLSDERLQHLCKGECYNPSDSRRLITRIEVVRIQPQNHPDEPVASLIQSPWRSFECEPDPAGCSVTFEDPEYATDGRDTLYYVRAIESPAPGINAASLRCEYDEEGRCVKVDLCNDISTGDGDCLAEHEPRAWSSPIFVDFAAEEPTAVSEDPDTEEG
jgi:hypothetical protein